MQPNQNVKLPQGQDPVIAQVTTKNVVAEAPTNPAPCIPNLTFEQIYRGNPYELAFIMKHGIQFKPAQLPPGTPIGISGHCYENAAKFAYLNPHLVYVEGIARRYENEPFMKFGTGCYVPFPVGVNLFL